MLCESRDEQTALAVWTGVPWNIRSWLAARVELDFLGVATGHICVLRSGCADALFLSILLLLLNKLALLLALGHVGRKRVAVDIVTRSLYPGIEHTVLLGQIRVLHALAHDGVHEARQLAMRTYYLRRRLERIPLEKHAPILIFRCWGLCDGNCCGAVGVLLLRLRLEVGEGD